MTSGLFFWLLGPRRHEEIAHRADVLDVEDKPLRRSLCNVDSVGGLARKVIDLFEVEYLAFSHLIGREVLAAVTRGLQLFTMCRRPLKEFPVVRTACFQQFRRGSRNIHFVTEMLTDPSREPHRCQSPLP